jgi:hypothetical protein
MSITGHSPPTSRTGALPTELLPHVSLIFTVHNNTGNKSINSASLISFPSSVAYHRPPVRALSQLSYCPMSVCHSQLATTPGTNQSLSASLISFPSSVAYRRPPVRALSQLSYCPINSVRGSRLMVRGENRKPPFIIINLTLSARDFSGAGFDPKWAENRRNYSLKLSRTYSTPLPIIAAQTLSAFFFNSARLPLFLMTKSALLFLAESGSCDLIRPSASFLE